MEGEVLDGARGDALAQERHRPEERPKEADRAQREAADARALCEHGTQVA